MDKAAGSVRQCRAAAPGADDKAMRRIEGIINLMTALERRKP